MHEPMLGVMEAAIHESFVSLQIGFVNIANQLISIVDDFAAGVATDFHAVGIEFRKAIKLFAIVFFSEHDWKVVDVFLFDAIDLIPILLFGQNF